MNKPIPNNFLNDLKPYKGGASSINGVDKIFKLSSNENPFGPSESVINAYNEAVKDITVYPDPSNSLLIKKLAQFYSINPNNIICGCGSDEILHLLARAYLSGNDEAIVSENSFAVYPLAIQASGARIVRAKEVNFQTQVNSILDLVNNSTKMIFIANPNNPTSTMIDAYKVQRLADGIPETCILVLDGAYAEYVPNFDGGASLIHERENVFMTRTFSKMYGLGGLRIGWGYGSKHVIDILNRIRGPFNLSTLALAAANSALTDVDYVDKSRNENTRLREWLSNSLSNLGIESDKSYANFILARFKGSEEASACYKFLSNEGVLVRHVANYNLPNCLRITIGDEVACKRVYESIRRFLESVR